MEYCQLYAYYKPVHLVIYKTSWLAMALFFLSLSLGEGIGNTQHKIDKNQLPLHIMRDSFYHILYHVFS